MGSASKTVEQARKLLERRLRELNDERHHLEAALADLDGGPKRVDGHAKRAPGRPRGSTGQRQRRRGTRANQAIRIIKRNPGISVSELGRKMKLNHPNYLYRVLPDLEKDGRIKRDGRGYHAA